MELIVAVYDDWGIGRDGTQPSPCPPTRKFFRTTTRGAMVIAGRRTIEDFPGKQPLPGRVNVALSRSGAEIPGFTVCDSAEKAAALSRTAERCFVIGGGSVLPADAALLRRGLYHKSACDAGIRHLFPKSGRG